MDKSFLIFREHLAHSNDFSSEELDLILSKMEHKRVPKKTHLLSIGEICDFEAFVLKGIGISYFIHENGSKVILSFASESWWLIDIESFHRQTPSKMCIETIEEMELLCLSHKDKEELLQSIPKLERMYRLMLQNHLVNYQQRLLANIAHSGKERYQAFIEKYPDVMKRVPQHLIASYLGITAEFLSRIRADKN
jgi:CRP-like cAMP-binding protein